MKAKVNRQSVEVSISNNLIRKRIQTIAKENGLSEQVQSVFVNLFDFMMKEQLYGGCHSISSALYVALCELGETPQLCIGECLNPKEKPFDHSWITLNGKIIDIAIYMPITLKRNSISGVVIMDIDTVTQTKTVTKYGYVTGLEFDCDTQSIIDTPFVQFMSTFPYESNGLWDVVKLILPENFDFDVEAAKVRYANVDRILCTKASESNLKIADKQYVSLKCKELSDFFSFIETSCNVMLIGDRKDLTSGRVYKDCVGKPQKFVDYFFSCWRHGVLTRYSQKLRDSYLSL